MLKKPRPTYILVRWLFVKCVGIIYLLAFASLATQILGLLGSEGVLPVKDFFLAVKEHYGAQSFWLVPSLFWINASDTALVSLCVAGSVLAVFLILGLAPTIVSFILWVFYLSITTVGQDFLGFQWDALLLEVGFLTIFFAERSFRPRIFPNATPAIAIVWVLRFVLFKLMFSSGVVKLASGDKTWSQLTALTYHYMTQPLPSPTSWFVHQWPLWAHKFCNFFLFVIELIVPFFIFLGRRMRQAAFVCFVFLQIIIMLTGNYCFFNLLTILLCLVLLDDETVKKFFPGKFIPSVESALKTCPKENLFEKYSLIAVACLIFLVNLQYFPFSSKISAYLKPLKPLTEKISYLHSCSPYGLFAVMTTRRWEIVIEGSLDGRDWKEYEFRYKPGRLDKIPGWVAPHQPRLDWQMWFAALGSYKQNFWVISLMQKILEGSKPVLGLLDLNPFKETPPKYLRAIVYDYTFTDSSTRKKTGAWWNRKLVGLYCPVLMLK